MVIEELTPGERLLLFLAKEDEKSVYKSANAYPNCFHCDRTFTKEDKANYVWMCPECGFSQNSMAQFGIHHDEYTDEGEVHTKNFATGECIIRRI